MYVPEKDRIKAIPNLDVQDCLQECDQQSWCQSVGFKSADVDKGRRITCFLLKRIPNIHDMVREGSNMNLKVMYEVW